MPLLFLFSMAVGVLLLRSELVNIIDKEDGGGFFGIRGLVNKRAPKGVEGKDLPYLKMKG